MYGRSSTKFPHKNLLSPAHQRGDEIRMNINIKVAVDKINFFKLFHDLKLLKSSQALV
jgi:hypothetical protein